jgi:hypothetical protein
VTDRHVLRVGAKWALAYDDLQWILKRFIGTRKSGARAGQEIWEDVSFVSSTKAILARCMREKGVPADDIRIALDRLPDTFAEFIRSPDRKAGPGLHSPETVSPRTSEPLPPNMASPPSIASIRRADRIPEDESA